MQAFKERVVEAVKERIKQANKGTFPAWFDDVCLDQIVKYTEDQFEDAVEAVYFDTLLWDAPNCGF